MTPFGKVGVACCAALVFAGAGGIHVPVSDGGVRQGLAVFSFALLSPARAQASREYPPADMTGHGFFRSLFVNNYVIVDTDGDGVFDLKLAPVDVFYTPAYLDR